MQALKNIKMRLSDGQIYFMIWFNDAFKNGETYTLPAGSVFGFTDGSKYTLDKDYTFTFDGTGWTMTASEPEEPEVTEPEATEPAPAETKDVQITE